MIFINGMELWFVRLIKNKVEVDVKLYQAMWDEEMIEMGNCFHTRDEAEVKAEQIRWLMKQPVEAVKELPA